MYNNCYLDKFNSQDIVYLRVKGHPDVLEDCKFLWEWSLDGGEPSADTTGLRQDDTPSHVFIILSHSLKAGNTYNFKCSGK